MSTNEARPNADLVPTCRDEAYHAASDTGCYDPNGHAITEERWDALFPPTKEADRG